jgi:hypothetical protein
MVVLAVRAGAEARPVLEAALVLAARVVTGAAVAVVVAVTAAAAVREVVRPAMAAAVAAGASALQERSTPWAQMAAVLHTAETEPS